MTSDPDISGSPPAALWNQLLSAAGSSCPGRPGTSRSSLLSVTGAMRSRSHRPRLAVRLLGPAPSPQPCSSQQDPERTPRPCAPVGTRFSQHLSAPLSVPQPEVHLAPYISRAFVPCCSVTPSAGSRPSRGHRLACFKHHLLHEAFVVSSEISDISSVI